ncbi:hypothetical protein [Bradyrhizobium erythrophlei]|jgi:hypothetical protein|uniref:hypothetical protein n=1 Tax=Bradyrhizobium erythrophlei TaxID=1437360 RepID=UPI000934ADA9|nr:hypothetical protein [Bradyrhizobium erythrophlei]
MTGQTCHAPHSNTACIHLSLKVARVPAIAIKLGFMQRTSPEALFPDRTTRRRLAPQIESFGGEERSQQSRI